MSTTNFTIIPSRSNFINASDYITFKKLKAKFCNIDTKSCSRQSRFYNFNKYSFNNSGDLIDYNKLCLYNNKKNFKLYSICDFRDNRKNIYDNITYKPLKLANNNENSLQNTFPYFINASSKTLKDSVLIIAFISNFNNEIQNIKQYSVSFQTIYLEYNYLKKLLFDTNLNDFYISPSNRLNDTLLFNKQMCNDLPFVLTDYLLKAYEELNETTRNSLPRETIMRLDKETSNIISIVDVKPKQVSLNWDQDILTNLLTNKIIEPTSIKNLGANVTFSINVLYFSETLQLNLSMNFYFQTDIPGYNNIHKFNKDI